MQRRRLRGDVARHALRTAWPGGAGRLLIALLAAGVALRLLAIVSWWPTTTTLDDAYEFYARSNPFLDPQHPAGYGLIIDTIGAVTRQVAVPVLIQHLSGLISAGLLADATRRLTGSAWAGLLPAAVVLLNPDQIFLEHAIMSESWAILATSAGLYATVRAFDDPRPWWRWPLLSGAALAAAVPIRTAGLPLIPVAVIALVVCRRQPLRRLYEHWQAPIAAAGAAGAVLLVFAAANASFGPRFGIAPSPGWYLYGRVAQFADCGRFTPPPGTAGLCETRPAVDRGGSHFYLFDPAAPGVRLFGGLGQQDTLVGQWAQRALQAQPGDFLSTAWVYLRGYWLPSARPKLPDATGLDPQLDFTFGNPFFAPAIEQRLETFYDDFTVHPHHEGLQILRDWQRVGRFGATALCITTLLMALGLAFGTRRSRSGVLLFGVGGITLLAAPALTGNYVGRYTVPMAGQMTAAAAISLVALWRARATRRRRAGSTGAAT